MAPRRVRGLLILQSEELMDAYWQALDAAHQSIDDGSIDEFYSRRDEYGFRSILAHSDQGWFTWYNEADGA